MDFRTDLEKRFFEEELKRTSYDSDLPFHRNSEPINYQLMAQLEAKRLGQPYCIIKQSTVGRLYGHGNIFDPKDTCDVIYQIYQCMPPHYTPEPLEECQNDDYRFEVI
ncbi:MAG: hypothetical protein SOZ00_05205 [Tidjanibacter sp.]|nr:hypothetical protein [Tidjanibacter sp.]